MLLALLLACPSSSNDSNDSEPIACSTYAAASVSVSVTDTSGAPVHENLTVQWSTDEVTWQDAECFDTDCSTWIAGWEVSGPIHVIARYEATTTDPCCWYSDSVEETVEIEMDAQGCHVIGQTMNLVVETDQLTCADSTECG